MKKASYLAVALSSLMLFSCSEEASEVTVEVSQGQKIWQTNCAVCHNQGLGGAPMIGNKVQWKSRLAQGLPTLFEHAKNGYSGETGEMPPRGGNPSLTDEEIELAVIYMTDQAR